MSFNIYIILLIVVLILNFLMWVLVVCYRLFCRSVSVPRSERIRFHRQNMGRQRSYPILEGLRNPAFENTENGNSSGERPFTVTEVTEAPPSYEEATKSALIQAWNSTFAANNNYSQSRLSAEEPSATPEQETTVTSSQTQLQAVSDLEYRPNSPLRSSPYGCTPPTLSTISEEDGDDDKVVIVIDTIGVQASRLMDACNTVNTLTDGHELHTHSSC